MLSRVAEHVLWMSRYVERAENTARIIDVNFRLLLDTGVGGDHAAAWEPLVGLMPETRALFDSLYPALTASSVCHFLTFERENPNSILSALACARENARGVRESISSEMWEQLNTLYLTFMDEEAQAAWARSPHQFYRQVQFGSYQFQGTTDATLSHDEGWHFIQVGKYLERADNVTRILDIKYRLLAPEVGAETTDAVQWMAMLKSCSAFEAYRRLEDAARMEYRGVAQFLLLDPLFPRSILSCVNQGWTALKAIGGFSSRKAGNGAERAMGLLRAQLEFADIDEVLLDMHAYLDGLQRHFNRVGDELQRVYLHTRIRPTFSTTEAGAAQVLTAQQQQQ